MLRRAAQRLSRLGPLAVAERALASRAACRAPANANGTSSSSASGAPGVPAFSRPFVRAYAAPAAAAAAAPSTEGFVTQARTKPAGFFEALPFVGLSSFPPTALSTPQFHPTR